MNKQAANQTYCKKQTDKSINWWNRIDRIHLVDKNTLKTWISQAANWVTCACGNQCDVIPRDREGEPDDGYLYDLGMEFSCLMDDTPDLDMDDPEAVRKHTELLKDILTKIENRSAELIEEIKNEKNNE